MAFTKEQREKYLRDIGAERKLSAEVIDRTIKILDADTDEAKALAEVIIDLPLSRHSEFSSAMDKARNAEQASLALYADNKRWREREAAPQLIKAQQDADALRKTVAAFEERFGPLDDVQDLGKGQSMTATGQVVKTSDIERIKTDAVALARAQMAKEFLAFRTEENTLQLKHAKLFGGEMLDTTALLGVVAKHAQDALNPQQISLTEAHNELYGAKITELEQHAREAEIKAAEKRGEDKGRAAVAASIERTGAAVPESGGFWDRMQQLEKENSKGQPTSSDSESAFVADLRRERAKLEAAENQ